MSNDKIYYKGLEMLADVVDDSTVTMYFNHIYRGTYDSKYYRHACLWNGYWCWKNALRHPQDIIKYLRKTK